MAGNVVRVATQVTGTAKASSDLDRLRDKFSALQKQGAKGFAIGAGAAITTAGLNLMGGAVNAVTGFLGDSTRAFAEEQVSIAQLGAALRANIPAWDGNTAAIEDVLKARMALGFSDDAQRESLRLLVAVTHDATKALAIQRIAMDLARFKGIDLAAATLALVKVENGQFTGLKRLGIALKEGATATEALAAVQAVAKGQAETYTQAIDEQQHAAGAQGSILDVLAENWGKAGREADQYVAELDAMAENADKTDRGHRGLAAAAGTADTKSRRLRTDAERLGKSLKDVKDDAVSAASGLAELVFGPAELKAHAEADRKSVV